MERIPQLHVNLVEQMSRFYGSHRTRCVMLKAGGKNHNIDFCRVYQPFAVTETKEILWESDSIVLIEEQRNIPNDYNLLDVFDSPSLKIGNLEIVSPGLEFSQELQSRMYYHPSWMRRYRSASAGISLKCTTGLPLPHLSIKEEDVRQEIQFHPKSPHHHMYDLMTSFGAVEGDPQSRSVVEIVAPFWARIASMEVDGRKIVVKYEIPSAMESSLNVWKNIETADGSLHVETVGFGEPSDSQTGNGIRTYQGGYIIPEEITNPEKVRIVLNVDEKFAIGWENKEIGPSRINLWSFLEEQEVKSGKIKSMIDGNKGSHSIDQFEYGVGLLLTSFGFRVAYTGRLLEPGPDLVAIDPDNEVVMVVECGRANFEQKVAACSERLEQMRTNYPQYSFLGATFTSATVSQEIRVNMKYPGVTLLDAKDIEVLVETVYRKPDANMFLDSLKRSSYSISWVGF